MKNKLTSGLLAFFLGGIGIHKFYLEETTAGVLYLLFAWTGIPSILALIDAVILLTMSDEDFNEKYNNTQTVQRNNQSYNSQYSAQDAYPSIALNPIETNTIQNEQRVTDLLIKYKNLLDEDIISQEEFDALKHSILSN